MPHLTRRQLLVGLGAASAASAVCAWGGIGVLALLIRDSNNQPTPTPLPPPSVTPLPAPRMVSRAEWGALAPNHDAKNETGFYTEENPEGWRVYDNELADVYQTVVVHHSVVYENTDLRTVQAIQTLHRDTRGWADVAYHFFVGRSGLIYEGRDWTVRGTHVGGYNTGSIGVCLLGNFMEQEVTPAQISSTTRLINWLAARLQLTHIAGHRDFNTGTQCPGDNLVLLMGQFAAAANLAIGTDGYISPDATPTCDCCDCADNG